MKDLFNSPKRLLIVALVSAIVFTLVIGIFNPERRWDWLLTLVATSISALFAVAAGIWLFNFQTNAKNDSRTAQLRYAVDVELKETLKALQSADGLNIPFSDGTTENVVITHLSSLALEEAARSTLFNAETTSNMTTLARCIRAYNMKVSYLLVIMSGGVAPQPNLEPLLKHALENIEASIHSIIHCIESEESWLQE
jgi:hypothetical protein